MTADSAACDTGQTTSDTLIPIRCRQCDRMIGEASPGSRVVIRCRRCGCWNDAQIPVSNHLDQTRTVSPSINHGEFV